MSNSKLAVNLQHVTAVHDKIQACNTDTFVNSGQSYVQFLTKIKVIGFRRLKDIEISFENPITVISGTNKVGKTSILLLIACSYEDFEKLDSTSPKAGLRPHAWKDVLAFTSHEIINCDYQYELAWRVGEKKYTGFAKRLASSKAWSGLGKKSTDPKRVNAKIRGRQVRLIDYERILPGRSFSNSLFKKANSSKVAELPPEVEEAFAYLFDLEAVKIFSTGMHLNKRSFLIEPTDSTYSTFNAASGEEAALSLLLDIFESPTDSLILIDEIEAGFHPTIQRKLIEIVECVSWAHKKQFIITTHSPTILACVPSASRKFIETTSTGYKVIQRISPQSARAKMDSISHPLVRLYCEDELAAFLITKFLTKISAQYKCFNRLFNVIKSGSAEDVRIDYLRHQKNYEQFTDKVGFCAVFDGDCKDQQHFSHYFDNSEEYVDFLFPFEPPESFLVQAFANTQNSSELSSAIAHKNHHKLFDEMVQLGFAADKSDARNSCYAAFESSDSYEEHAERLKNFLFRVAKFFSEKE